MKILWITNTLFPEASRLLFGDGESRGSGGWMLASAEALSSDSEIKLHIACVSPNVNELKRLEGLKMVFYVLPLGEGNKRLNKEYEKYWLQIKDEIQPDIVHIHGTEFTHGLAYVQACGSDNVVVSIQGMKSVIADYYTAGLSFMEIISNLTIHDVLKGGIYAEQRDFRRTGELEKKLLRSVNHVIGRTSWDKAHTWAINPKLKYHFCNESLRAEFMDGSKWSYDCCTKHTIFLSNAIYPLKGFHQMLKAMPIILKFYPDTTVRVAGNDITSYRGLNAIRHNTTYWNIIRGLIKKFNLSEKIIFTGNLNAEQMKQEYLKTNVYVCPSSIENSPNSIGEAQVLGVPCVASYVGGIPDLMQGLENNMFRFDDIEMLAYKVCDVFADTSISSPIVEAALSRHNVQENKKQLVNIYKAIV